MANMGYAGLGAHKKTISYCTQTKAGTLPGEGVIAARSGFWYAGMARKATSSMRAASILRLEAMLVE